MSGPHFRDYHLLLDEHGDQLFAMTDPIAERIRKIGGLTIKSIGHISRLQRVLDNDADYVAYSVKLSIREFRRYRPSVGFCNATAEVMLAPSFEIERSNDATRTFSDRARTRPRE